MTVEPGRYPHYHLVPKDLKANLEFRRELLRYGGSRPERAAQLRAMCAADLLFYVNAFVWAYNPKLAETPVVPFITWPYQDGTFQLIEQALGDHDLVLEKGRELGVTWIVLIAFEHRWHFKPYQSFLLVSRKEELVDLRNDPKSLMYKIDHIHAYEPRWLLPGFRYLGWDDPNRALLRMYNPVTHATISGESTSEDLGRSDRRTGVMVDEAAALPNGDAVRRALVSVTDSCFWISTPQGENAFARLRRSSRHVVSIHWTQHPERVTGLYFDDQGRARSPWYDHELLEVGDARIMAQEHDIDYLGSDYSFFDPMILDRLIAETGRPPFVTGRMEIPKGSEEGTFVEGDGPVRLWVYLDERGRPVRTTRLAAGADVAAGTCDPAGRGASNSALALWAESGERIADLVVHGVEPHVFARLAVAVCRWFASTAPAAPFLIWEANGPGALFGHEVSRLRYNPVYYDPRISAQSIRRRMELPGWWSRPQPKMELLGEYRRALATGEARNRSAEALEECRYYIQVGGNQNVVHSRAESSEDPRTARANHGDIVIADALAWHCIKNRVLQKVVAAEAKPRGMCLAERRRLRVRREQLARAW